MSMPLTRIAFAVARIISISASLCAISIMPRCENMML